MKIAIGIFIQIFSLSAWSTSFFLLSNILMPVQSKLIQQPANISKMTIHFDEFSPAFAALEDDYYVAEYEQETIPQDIPAQELAPGKIEFLREEKIELPKMALNPQQSLMGMSAALQTLANNEKKALAVDVVNKMKSEATEMGLFPHHWIQGKLELSEGLAITDPRDEVRVGWFVDGEKRRDGKVSIRDGAYEIRVDRLEGELIAELVDRKGFLLGEAIVDLEHLGNLRNTNALTITGVDLQLKPYNFGFKAQTFSSYSTKNNKFPIAHADVSVGHHEATYRSNDKGKLFEESVSPHSTAVLIAGQQQYRDSVVLADLEKEQELKLYPEKFLTAFFDIIGLEKAARLGGVIWGTVLQNGSPAAGFKLQLREQKNWKPIYSQYYIADKKLEKTSEDGQSIFVSLHDGEYEVEVVDTLDRVIDSKLVVVRAGAVSDVQFEVGEKRFLKVRTFDPLSATQKSVEFFALGQQGTQQTITEEILSLPVMQGQDPLLLYTKSEGAKIETTTFISRNKKFQEVPVLNVDWWNQVQHKFQLRLESGVIAGFVDSDEAFEVFVEKITPQTKIVYLNSSGQPIELSSGQKPAGFLIYGVGQGLHTLVLESEQGLISTEAAYVQPDAVALIYKSL